MRAVSRTVCIALLLAATAAATVLATLPADRTRTAAPSPKSTFRVEKSFDEPNPLDAHRVREHRRFIRELERQLTRDAAMAVSAQGAAAATTRAGTDRVLVILVEFAGSDTFTWTAGSSKWDPIGKADSKDAVYDADGKVKIGDCANIITATRTFTYAGPLHGQIERPRSAADPSGTMIWMPDFAASYYQNIIFGNGITFDYTRQDGSPVREPFPGRSVATYYQDMSAGRYSITGDIVGWLQLPHSAWYYGADPCPGARSGASSSSGTSGAIPGAGSARQLVRDAIAALNTARPNFDWASYDLDHDGLVDRIWIIHAGLGEEETATLLNRTSYGEGGLWSHSGSLSPAYQVTPSVAVGPYIMMPENAGIGVLAHEFGHNLGAADLYSYGEGETSAGFWTVMADDWTGFPIGFQPAAFDPWHLDGWGWLDPVVVNEGDAPVTVTLGAAGNVSGAGLRHGVKINLADQAIPLPVRPVSAMQWWGGATNSADAMATMRQPFTVPPAGATLHLTMAWDTEPGWDFLWVQASQDGGGTWKTLTNADTTCTHDPQWVGTSKGFPADLCGAGIGGFSGTGAEFPLVREEAFDLAPFAGRALLLRLWYMTDAYTLGSGVFIGALTVRSDATEVFSTLPESAAAQWRYDDGWNAVTDSYPVPHAFYLQWRDVSPTGGWDSALGEPRWRFGPAATGLLVWYNNDFYSDNEIGDHLFDVPGFGPKGRMLVVDAHPEPYRSPAAIVQGWDNEAGNLLARGQMRDAPFSLEPTPSFTFNGESFAGRPGMPLFSDASGYFPGAADVSFPPGATNPPNGWMSQHWDASVVLPSRAFCGIKAPGYTADDPLRYDCSRSTDGTLKCVGVRSGGLGYDGGTGNPADVLGQYGWNVQILEQSGASATIRVWHESRPEPPRVRRHVTGTQ